MNAYVSLSRSLGFFFAPALAAMIAVFMVGCNAKTVCEQHYSTASEQQACQVGAEVEGAGVIASSGNDLPREQRLSQMCEDRCGHRYNPNQVKGSGDAKYFDEIAALSRLLVACKDACRVRVKYEDSSRNNANKDRGCEEIKMGSVIRCL